MKRSTILIKYGNIPKLKKEKKIHLTFNFFFTINPTRFIKFYNSILLKIIINNYCFLIKNEFPSIFFTQNF